MVNLNDLTVGDVSGMIAAAITIAHLTVILAAPLIVLSIFKKKSANTASAVTWSVIGRSLHSSWWPFLVRADSAVMRGVPSYLVFMTRLKTGLTLLISIAAVVTPLGLYQTITPSDKPTPSSFHYITDPGDFGKGTLQRGDVPFSRICGAWDPVACPNSFSNVTYWTNSTGTYFQVYNYDSHIPHYVVDAFESGLAAMEPSVSSIFDIQSRSYSWADINDNPGAIQPDNGSPVAISTFQQIRSMTTENKFLAIEGLVVDMISGGVGFRNHTAPPRTPFGSIWSEDLLFIEPESVCVDLNLTIDFMVPKYSSQTADTVHNLVMTDRGGFVNLNRTYPEWDAYGDRQEHPELERRAYKAAWLNNAYTMAFMNITSIHNDSIPGSRAFAYLNSELGKTFPLSGNSSQPSALLTVAPNVLSTTSVFGEYLTGLDEGYESSTMTSGSDSSENYTFPATQPLYPNPWKIDSAMWTDVGVVCSGAGGADKANITNTAAICGLVYGAPRRLSPGPPLLIEPGSNWSIPMYSCISSPKALIKTVSFRFNGSDDLSGLTVTDIKDKVYADNASKPIWGVEHTNLNLSDVSPLWGLVSSPDQGNISLSTVQREHLYLPGYVSGSGGVFDRGFQNLPGITFYIDAVTSVFQIGPTGSLSVADYTGKKNLAMLRQWQELSSNASSVSRILNLIWTDLAANIVVGTKTLEKPQQQALQKRADDNGNNHDASPGFTPKVDMYQRRVRYHWPYGIPALLALVITAIMVTVTIAAVLFGLARPDQMRHVLNQTSQGRILTARGHKVERAREEDGSLGSSEVIMSDTPTKQWAQTVGKTPITLAEDSQYEAIQPHYTVVQSK